MGLAICCRMGGATSRSPKCGVASACGILRSPCVLRAFSVCFSCVPRALLPPGGAEAPPIRKRRGKRKRMEMQSFPLHPHVITSFFVVAFRCATSPNFCVYIRRVLFFYRTFFQRAVTAVFSKRALAPFCSGYTSRYSGCAYAKMPRNRTHAPAALKV